MKDSQGPVKLESPKEFARRLKIRVSDYLLLSRALTHRSYLNEHPEAIEDNERLEFLGDAVLDFVVGAWLYNHFPEMSEGDMTRIRAALVKTEQLAEFASQIDLGSALRLGRGEEESGGRKRPAMLCASFEAFIGALYLDGSISNVEAFMDKYLHDATERVLKKHEYKDPKSFLQEWSQAHGHSTPSYRIISETGPDHDKTFIVEVIINKAVFGKGRGKNKQSAEKSAARDAIQSHNLSLR